MQSINKFKKLISILNWTCKTLNKKKNYILPEQKKAKIEEQKLILFFSKELFNLVWKVSFRFLIDCKDSRKDTPSFFPLTTTFMIMTSFLRQFVFCICHLFLQNKLCWNAKLDASSFASPSFYCTVGSLVNFCLFCLLYLISCQDIFVNLHIFSTAMLAPYLVVVSPVYF